MAGFAALSIFSAEGVSVLLKDFFDRPRPEIVPHPAYPSSASFPGAHSMLPAPTCLSIAAMPATFHKRRRLKAFFLLTASLLVFDTGLSRIYPGMHWPTGVLAGWSAGGVRARRILLPAKCLQGRRIIERGQP